MGGSRPKLGDLRDFLGKLGDLSGTETARRRRENLSILSLKTLIFLYKIDSFRDENANFSLACGGLYQFPFHNSNQVYNSPIVSRLSATRMLFYRLPEAS